LGNTKNRQFDSLTKARITTWLTSQVVPPVSACLAAFRFDDYQHLVNNGRYVNVSIRKKPFPASHC